nr:hypothetical protein CFP56_38452 [Quercus suber]
MEQINFNLLEGKLKLRGIVGWKDCSTETSRKRKTEDAVPFKLLFFTIAYPIHRPSHPSSKSSSVHPSSSPKLSTQLKKPSTTHASHAPSPSYYRPKPRS